MSTAAGFNADLNAFADALELELDQVVRKIAFEAHSSVSKKTPVDTGRARANWNLSAGSIDNSTVPEMGKGTGEHKGQSSPPSSPSPKAVEMKQGDGEDVIYITNNLPYIGVLEDGSSTQAPIGMVAVTMAEIEAGIKDVI